MATRRLRSVVLTQVAPPIRRWPPLMPMRARVTPQAANITREYLPARRPGGRAGSLAGPPGRPGALPGGRLYARAVIMSVSCGDVAWVARSGWPGTKRDWRGPGRTEILLTKRALITGITGQDGAYLTEHLLSQGYEVWGLIRGQANPRVRGIRKLVGDVRLVRGDLLDQGSLISAVERVQPDEIYSLAAISYVPMSWQQAELTGEVTGLGVLRVLEAIRVCSGISASRSPARGQIRFYQASSSE